MNRKEELKTRTVTISFPPASFATIIYANRCTVENLDGHKIVIFGFEHGSDRRPETYCVLACVFDRFMLEQQRQSWLSYLSEIGYPEPSTPMDWKPPVDQIKAFPIINAAAFARTGDEAEIRCYNFAMGDVASPEILGTQNILGQSVALVRCGLELQRNFLAALFETP